MAGVAGELTLLGQFDESGLASDKAKVLCLFDGCHPCHVDGAWDLTRRLVHDNRHHIALVAIGLLQHGTLSGERLDEMMRY